MSSYKLTPEGLKPDDNEAREATQADIDKLMSKLTKTGQAVQLKLNTARFSDPVERNKCPEAYLLSAKEAELIAKARTAITDVNQPYIRLEADGTDITTPEMVTALITDYFTTFKARRISIKKIQAIIDKINTALYWDIQLTRIQIGGKERSAQYYTVITSTPDTIPNFEISYDTHKAFFEAENMRDRARAINIPDLYLYVTYSEIGTIKYIERIIKHWSNPDIDKKPLIDDTFITTINSPVLNAFSNIGVNARFPIVKKSRDEKGKQIDMTEYATNIGVKLSFPDFNPFGNTGIISVGDPNTDKLLLQAQLYTMQTGKQAFEIPLSEFKEFREITDNKTATEKAKRACETLLNAKLTIGDEHSEFFGGANFVQECYVLSRKGRGGNVIHINLSDKLYKHILDMSKSGKFISQLDRRCVTIPDNYATSYNIFRKYSEHLRTNAGEPTSHRLSVSTLLNFCCLPLYPINKEDIGKDNYLRNRGEAKNRIIKPFVNALEYLVDNKLFKEYTFTHTNGKPLTAKEAKAVYDDYNLFSSLNVDVVFTNEPDYDHLIGARNKQKDKAKKAKDKK